MITFMATQQDKQIVSETFSNSWVISRNDSTVIALIRFTSFFGYDFFTDNEDSIDSFFTDPSGDIEYITSHSISESDSVTALSDNQILITMETKK